MPTILNPAAVLGRARSLLFVPCNRPERFAKAIASGADAVVLDLEDSVPQAAKHEARQALEDHWPALERAAVPVVVRINVPTSPCGREDLAVLARLPAPAGIMVPKAESAADLKIVDAYLHGAVLLPLIETVAGLDQLHQIASAPQVLRLVVGHIDFMADSGLRCADDERELDPLRFAVAMQTRLCRLAAAVDGVTVAIDDELRLRADTLRALRFGYGGKLCIHPRQVAVVHAAMAPAPDELAWAQQVLDGDHAAGGVAFQLNGRMVDLPVVLQARHILARAAREAAP